ncbi:MAG TPA: STAS domain-containing protein [Acidobacteriota bacterium]|nr:STAS domain-containing protein [Acidobacteriota bacterium]
MKLTSEKHDGICFIIPEGELLAGQGDAELKAEMERLIEEGQRRIAVDFSDVPYIDSSILGQLVHGYSILKKEGGALKLLNPSKRIVDVLNLTRLISVFEVYEDKHKLIESFQ